MTKRSHRTLALRDPIHGFIHADPLEAALINSRPLQRLRSIRQLGFTYLIFPGAEHSRFSHVLGTMHMAGRLYDALARRSEGLLPTDERCTERRLIRLAALLHDIGHAPLSHTAEDQFENSIDHEEMGRLLLALPEIQTIFDSYGEGIQTDQVLRVLSGGGESAEESLLHQVISGELDADKMDYLQRDSLFCGVRYGHFDAERVLETVRPLKNPQTGQWGIGVDEGGIHALEALVMARYYMFTQVYFNVTGKVMEHHFSTWVEEENLKWSVDPEKFLLQDDVWITDRLRKSSNQHALAVVKRLHFPLAYESDEHLSREEKERFEGFLPDLRAQFGVRNLLISNSAKDPHRLGRGPVMVQYRDGRLKSMAEASHFISHLGRIERYRVYAATDLRDEVRQWLSSRWWNSTP